MKFENLPWLIHTKRIQIGQSSPILQIRARDLKHSIQNRIANNFHFHSITIRARGLVYL